MVEEGEEGDGNDCVSPGMLTPRVSSPAVGPAVLSTPGMMEGRRDVCPRREEARWLLSFSTSKKDSPNWGDAVSL